MRIGDELTCLGFASGELFAETSIGETDPLRFGLFDRQAEFVVHILDGLRVGFQALGVVVGGGGQWVDLDGLRDWIVHGFGSLDETEGERRFGSGVPVAQLSGLVFQTSPEMVRSRGIFGSRW